MVSFASVLATGGASKGVLSISPAVALPGFPPFCTGRPCALVPFCRSQVVESHKTPYLAAQDLKIQVEGHDASQEFIVE